MMSNETQNMIDAATNKDGAAFKEAFDTLIQQKVGENLQTQRQDIALNIFGNIRVPTSEAIGPGLPRGGIRGGETSGGKIGRKVSATFPNAQMAKDAIKEIMKQKAGKDIKNFTKTEIILTAGGSRGSKALQKLQKIVQKFNGEMSFV